MQTCVWSISYTSWLETNKQTLTNTYILPPRATYLLPCLILKNVGRENVCRYRPTTSGGYMVQSCTNKNITYDWKGLPSLTRFFLVVAVQFIFATGFSPIAIHIRTIIAKGDPIFHVTCTIAAIIYGLIWLTYMALNLLACAHQLDSFCGSITGISGIGFLVPFLGWYIVQLLLRNYI